MAKLATIAAFGFAAFDPPTLLRMYRQMGCRTCQYYGNPESRPNPAEAKRIADDAGLPIDSMHGVFGPAYDPSSPDEAVRQASVQTYHREAGLVLELGGSMVVVHPAPINPNGAAITPNVQQARADALRQSMQQLAEIGGQLGVTFLFENLPGNYLFGHDTTALAGLIREMGHPRVRMCFDTGHAHMTQQDAPVADVLEACLDVVSYCHVSDNDGHADLHLMPGQGTIPWNAMMLGFERLPPDVSVMLEYYQNDRVLRQMLVDGWIQDLKRWLAVD